MKKKILAVVLAGVMAMSMLTACGGSAETAETTETADVETTEDAASDEACSDETFTMMSHCGMSVFWIADMIPGICS